MRPYKITKQFLLRVFAFSMAVAALASLGIDYVALLFFVDQVILIEPNKGILALEVVIIIISCLILVVDFGMYMAGMRKK